VCLLEPDTHSIHQKKGVIAFFVKNVMKSL